MTGIVDTVAKMAIIPAEPVCARTYNGMAIACMPVPRRETSLLVSNSARFLCILVGGRRGACRVRLSFRWYSVDLTSFCFIAY